MYKGTGVEYKKDGSSRIVQLMKEAVYAAAD
jgi:hypothetical protein